MGKQRKPYRVCAAYDTETSNVPGLLGSATAFFSLYQVGVLQPGVALKDINAGNVRDKVDVAMYRDDGSAWAALLDVASSADGYVPVVAVHNLAFDIHSIAARLSAWGGVDVLAKSAQDPITVTLKRDGEPYLVFWDTLGFSGKSLETMGLECGYAKSVGAWDYDRVRAPETELTEDEVRYAGNDIYALFAWLGWYFRREPLLDETDAGRSLITKTGAVRRKRTKLFYDLKPTGGGKTCGRAWRDNLKAERLADDDYFYTVHASTRGGFTFASREYAGRVFEADGERQIYAFDATSQHPAHMVGHMVPYQFRRATPAALTDAFELVCDTSPVEVMERFDNPFGVAFDAAFDFCGLRLKQRSVFERDGIASLAYARLEKRRVEDENDFVMTQLEAMGYQDAAPDGCEHAFGKVFSAPYIRLYLTELEAWVISRIYEWDECVPVSGYMTARFRPPEDMSVLSVFEFYRRKMELKKIRGTYREGTPYPDDIPTGLLPDYMIHELECGTAIREDLDAYYMSAKADLNSLYGIEITDEAKRDTVLTENGIEYEGLYTCENLPEYPKAHYQYGQRVVGWSRVAQTLVIEGLGECGALVINGDTDSVKVWASEGDIEAGERFLDTYGRAVDRARMRVCQRVSGRYPDKTYDLAGIGWYICEGTYTRFMSAYNKAYVSDDWHITLAGVPSKNKRGRGLEDFGRALERQGMPFDEAARCVIGYNVTVAADVTGLLGRNHPGWGSRWQGAVTDWRGDTYEVDAPEAIGLYPLAKEIGGYANPENRQNASWAARYGADTGRRILSWDGDKAEVYRL